MQLTNENKNSYIKKKKKTKKLKKNFLNLIDFFYANNFFKHKFLIKLERILELNKF